MTRIEVETIMQAGYILDTLASRGIDAICISHRTHTVYAYADKAQVKSSLGPALRLGTIMTEEVWDAIS